MNPNRNMLTAEAMPQWLITGINAGLDMHMAMGVTMHMACIPSRKNALRGCRSSINDIIVIQLMLIAALKVSALFGKQKSIMSTGR